MEACLIELLTSKITLVFLYVHQICYIYNLIIILIYR